MTIAKPRKRPGATDAERSFVEAAPDARITRWQRGNKTQITLSITPDLLARIDTLADSMGQSRAALINLAIFEMAERRAPA